MQKERDVARAREKSRAAREEERRRRAAEDALRERERRQRQEKHRLALEREKLRAERYTHTYKAELSIFRSFKTRQCSLILLKNNQYKTSVIKLLTDKTASRIKLKFGA